MDGQAPVASEKAPAIPGELWMLWITPDHDSPEGGWCKAIDDPRGADNYLVCTNKADAEKAAEHQNNLYDFTCVPVRVK